MTARLHFSDRENIEHLEKCPHCPECDILMAFYQTCDVCHQFGHNSTMAVYPVGKTGTAVVVCTLCDKPENVARAIAEA